MWEQDLDQGSLWSSELSLATMLELLRIDILDCESQLDIVDFSLGIVPLGFYLETSCFIGFPGSLHLALFTFPLYFISCDQCLI